MHAKLRLMHLAVCLSAIAPAGTGCFGGYVTDGETGGAVDRAQISVRNCPTCAPATAQTASNGGWYFDSCDDPFHPTVLQKGVDAVEIQVSKSGYSPATVYHQVEYTEPYGNDCYKDQRDIQLFPYELWFCFPHPYYSADCDADGLPNNQENRIGTTYLHQDSDCDGAEDGWEVNGTDFMDYSVYGMSPTRTDCVFDWQKDEVPTQFTYIDNFPNDRARWIFNNIQGITHDDRHWYVSQKDETGKGFGNHPARLHKFHATANLSSDGPILSKSIQTWGDHPGDITYFKHGGGEYIFVPMYNSNHQSNSSRIVVFRASDLELQVTSNFSSTINGPSWVALDPSGRLYHNNSVILPEQGRRIQVYDVDWNKIANRDSSFLTHLHEFQLLREDNTEFATDDGTSNYRQQLGYQQGAAFSPDGELLVLAHGGGDVPASLSGVKVFQVINDHTGKILFRSSTSEMPFKFQFEPGWDDKWQEPEGVTFWDLDYPNDPDTPNISGQLHVLMLDNDVTTCDNIFFKHYRVPCGERCRL